MSNVGDALSGSGSSASGVNDQTFADASLGDQMQGGTGNFTDVSSTDAGGGGFQNFNDVVNALGGTGGPGAVGASPAASPTAAAASATGGDPVGASGGTQSSTTPGSSPGPNQQQQTQPNQQNQNDQQYAPKSATDQLKALLKQLSGKPTGPTGPTVPAAPAAPFALPTLAAGQTGPQSALRQLVGSQPAGASLEVGQTGPQSPGPGAGFAGSQPGGSADIPAEVPGDDELKFDPKTGTYTPQPGMVRTDDQGNPITAAGTRADQTPLPPPRPAGAQTAQAPGAAGRDITVQPKGGMPWPQKEPGEVAPGGPALPTRKPTQPPEAEQPAAPAPAPAPTQGAAPRLLQDISGASTGSPTALADLAQAARIILPLVGMFMGGGRGRRGGGFHGGRFTHGVGGFRGGHPGAFGHPSWRGAWPYHHPMHGWDMHHQHPGGGWLPLNPAELQGMGGGQGGPGGNQGGPQASNPTQTTEPGPGQPDDTFQKSGFSANPFVDALVRQESGGGQNIVSKTDKDSQGRTLAQGGNPNEISQGYFQIQNHPGGTWTTYGRQAGIDLNKYPTPRSAPLAVQWQVAQRIPIGQWGSQTKAILRQKFGQFDPNMPFGQVASRFGPAGGRLAAATPSRTQPAWASGPASASLQLPVTSQPSVSASN
jgi:hypothetical protein